MAKEMAPCRQLLDDLESHDEAWPFLLPVNTKQFPTYKKIIKNPMDLSTIRKRLMDSGFVNYLCLLRFFASLLIHKYMNTKA